MKRIDKNSSPYRSIQGELWNDTYKHGIRLNDFGLDFISEVMSKVASTIYVNHYLEHYTER